MTASGQGRERRAQVCTCTRAQAKPGPCFSQPTTAGRCPGSTILLLSPSSSPAPVGQVPKSAGQPNAGGQRQRGVWGDGSCSHVSEQGLPWGELMYVQELGQKETQGSGSPGRALTHRPGSLPRASGSTGQRQPSTSARWVPFLLQGEVGRERVWGWGAVFWATRCRIGPPRSGSPSAVGQRAVGLRVCFGVSLLPRACPVCQDLTSLEGGAGWPRLGAAGVTAAMSTCREGGQRGPGMNLPPGMRGCWCCSPHCSGGGSRSRGGGMGLAREAPAPQGRGASSASSGCSPSLGRWRWQESRNMLVLWPVA